MIDAIAAALSVGPALVLTGAGISAESGIPTFRDAQTGHWARFRPEDLASPDAYRRDPELVRLLMWESLHYDADAGEVPPFSDGRREFYRRKVERLRAEVARLAADQGREAAGAGAAAFAWPDTSSVSRQTAPRTSSRQCRATPPARRT